MNANDKPAQIQEIEHCWIPMPDGVRLSARLWIPVAADDKPHPAILEYIPYRKHDMVRARDERNHPYFARHGYACVRVDMRGSGDSEGLMADMYSLDELEDAITVIDWIAQQPWCSGSIGMMGTSWGGTASLQAASKKPPALKAIIAVCATNNRFDDDIHHMGGCLLTDTVEWGATLPAILAAPPDRETVGENWREMWTQRLEHLSFPLKQWIEHETRNNYWRWGSIDETPKAIQLPTLAIGGWVDRYSNTVMNLVAGNKDHCWGIVGPWGHQYPDAASPGPGIDFQNEAVRWWDRWLKNINNGVDKEPRLKVWMQAFIAPADSLDARPGRWIGEADWPSKNIELSHYWFSDDQLVQTPVKNTSQVNVPNALNVGLAAGDTGYFGRAGGLPLDQEQDDEFSLVFESAPLTSAIEILGSVRLTLSLSCDQPIATLIARLNDVASDGAAARVTYAFRNLALNENGEPLEKSDLSKPRLINVTFPNTAYKFDRGHRVRLALSSSYWPLIRPSPKLANISIALQHAKLSLPLRTSTEDSNDVHFSEPMIQNNSAIKQIESPKLVRRIDIDSKTNQQTVAWHQPLTKTYYADINLYFSFETSAEHQIILDDACSATSTFTHLIALSRESWETTITSTASVTCTSSTYEISGEIKVTENQKELFAREWISSVSRKYS